MGRGVAGLLPACAGILIVASIVARAQSAGRTTDDGVYTDTQAERGSVLFSDVCRACHPDPFWRVSWRDRTVGDLYTTIVKSMPDDNPGSISGSEAVDLLAYILQGNGAPSGTAALPDDPEGLAAIRLMPPR